MLERFVEKTLERVPALQEQGLKISRAVHQVVLGGGTPARKLADVLHGTWLGHPLHPILTAFVIGAWGPGAPSAVLPAVRGDDYAERVADTLATAGPAAAVPTVVTGLADYSTVQKPAVSAPSLHAFLTDVNFALYLLSLRARRRGIRRCGVFYSSLAIALTVVSAWLGGYLVYSKKVGVDHSKAQGPAEWTPALDTADLSDGEPKRVEVEGNPVLLYRQNGTVHAIGAVCNHAGGPLEKGTFDGCYVQCPWHDSVFDMRDGRVAHGPAVRTQPRFATRVRDGHIEVRRLRS